MRYLYLILFIVTGSLVSCTQVTTGGISSVTNYPIITLNGDDVVFVQVGDPYVDAGAVSTEGGEEIETVTTFGNGLFYGQPGVDTDTADLYTITYSATNQDGFDGNASRSVIVANTGDLVTSIEGLYTSDVQRAPDFTPLAQYDDLEYVLISKTGDNTYAITHAIGAYYSNGRGYGSNYAAKGAEITANSIPGNDFSFSSALIPGFGLVIDMTDMVVDAANKSITFTGFGDFGNGTFKVQLTQVQF